jgi:hypothetical protein
MGDQYEDYDCWTQYYFFLDYLTSRGYDASEILGSGESWKYVEGVLEQTDLLPGHNDFASKRRGSGSEDVQFVLQERGLDLSVINEFAGFSDGYYFMIIYSVLPELAVEHGLMLQYEGKSERPNSYNLSQNFVDEFLGPPAFPFEPITQKGAEVHIADLISQGRDEDAQFLQLQIDLISVGWDAGGADYDVGGVSVERIEFLVALATDIINSVSSP